MELIRGAGVVSQSMLDALNRNFALISGIAQDRFYVSKDGSPSNDGSSPSKALDSIQRAHDLATPGDQIVILPGQYSEELSITKSKLSLFGLGGRGSVFIRPASTNKTAVLVEAESDVTLENIGCEGRGTKFGLHVKGDVSRFRARGCKLEGGVAACKLESTAAGSVSDVRLEDVELCWSDEGLLIDVTGGGDPVTQVLLRNSLLHNVASGIRNATAHTVDLWIQNNLFGLAADDGSEMTTFLDIAVANTTGFVTGNQFATTAWAAAKFAIASGVLFAGNFAQAEGPATGGGTAGRPD